MNDIENNEGDLRDNSSPTPSITDKNGIRRYWSAVLGKYVTIPDAAGRIGECTSYPVSIFIAGSSCDAETICRSYCEQVGLCVTVTETNYVYTNGEEAGVVVGLINYPRFPAAHSAIFAKAEELAHRLIEGLKQQSATIQAPDKTVWISFRDQDAAAALRAHAQSRRERKDG